MPDCKKPKGCPIEDIATDVVINEFCEAFLQARSMFELNHLPTLLQDAYERLGLIDDPNFLFALENIYSDFKAKAAEDARQKASRKTWNKII